MIADPPLDESLCFVRSTSVSVPRTLKCFCKRTSSVIRSNPNLSDCSVRLSDSDRAPPIQGEDPGARGSSGGVEGARGGHVGQASGDAWRTPGNIILHELEAFIFIECRTVLVVVYCILYTVDFSIVCMYGHHI